MDARQSGPFLSRRLALGRLFLGRNAKSASLDCVYRESGGQMDGTPLCPCPLPSLRVTQCQYQAAKVVRQTEEAVEAVI
jgi:hypothetical protein